MDRETFLEAASALGYALGEVDLDRIDRYQARLEEESRKSALTRVTAPEDYIERHVLDALSVVVALEHEHEAPPSPLAPPSPPARIADVGSGAGIPAIPLAIALPAHRLYRPPARRPEVHAIEAQAKKAAFIRRAAEALGLEALRVAEARAEDLAREPSHREAYDLVVARAVAELRILAELCLPLVRLGGLFVAYKGPRADAEVDAAERALAALGGTLEAVLPAPLPGRDLRLVKVRKAVPTPERYPRRAGVPRKRPL